jgi:spoIIIJ-associated protein
MEWVEFTAKTVREAMDQALDQLGIAEDDAEFVTLEEPRAGLFGRVRGEAKVRARVRPTAPRAKPERRERKKKSAPEAGETAAVTAAPKARAPRKTDKTAAVTQPDETSSDAAPQQERRPRTERGPRPERAERAPRPDRPERPPADIEEVAAEAARFLEGLAAALGVEAKAEVRRQDNDVEVLLDGGDLGVLIGPRGSTLLAVQDLTRVASQRRLGDHDSHLRIDIGGYRERRREALNRFTLQIIDQVKESGVARALEPMPSADRKVVHDTVGDAEGVVSRSEGDDPFRKVVIAPAG